MLHSYGNHNPVQRMILLINFQQEVGCKTGQTSRPYKRYDVTSQVKALVSLRNSDFRHVYTSQATPVDRMAQLCILSLPNSFVRRATCRYVLCAVRGSMHKSSCARESPVKSPEFCRDVWPEHQSRDHSGIQHNRSNGRRDKEDQEAGALPPKKKNVRYKEENAPLNTTCCTKSPSILRITLPRFVHTNRQTRTHVHLKSRLDVSHLPHIIAVASSRSCITYETS